ncbi:prolyl oligopeptidase family protein [Streptomyces sp. NPDC012888]|uniref:prolyl oligopeptidase family serine peptidase n=1 Tax=Streptomyces sp. NPDC012888 TaxID=3364855 RepID=UPI0036C7B0B3
MNAVNDDDPYLWLEETEGAAALAWVAERNAETVRVLTADPGFHELLGELREVMDDRRRIPYPVRRGPLLYDFRQDDVHVRGLWRRTTPAEYREEEPDWEPLLDVDALAAAEGVGWAWAGAQVLFPDYERALVMLSREGADAVTVREFDLAAKEFVEDGFTVPEAKTSIAWIDRDHVFVATGTGPDETTAAGYPRTVRRWRRGTPLAEAETVFTAGARDTLVCAWYDPTPGWEREYVSLVRDTWHGELHLSDGDDGALRRLDVPDDADAHVHRRWLTVTPRSPWLGHPAGTLLAFDLADFLAGGREPAAVAFAPDARTALTGYTWTRNHLVVETLTDVSTRIEVLTPGPDGGAWTRRPLADVPPLSTACVTGTDPYTDDAYFLDVSGHLQPSTLHHGEIGAARAAEPVKRAPAHFDTTGLTVRQRFATSPDGTRVPYFVVGPDRETPGPVLMYGYGGFEYSLTPGYSGVTGRAWLARGGTYVVANVRGGGEYGPAWHQAALGAGRARAFDDFAAVARDLIARGTTTPAQLGIEGSSNGGLLTTAALTRHPELFGAVVAEVPLTDLLRYDRLLAGASWTGEYGDPRDEADRRHLAALSPYHRLRADRTYPPLLLLTSTRDDRVHPAHARKMAARMREMGHRVLFHENTEGGHAGATTTEQAAWNEALISTFLWQTLGRPGERAGRARQ